MLVLDSLYYSKDHEWVKVEGDTVFIGITDHAQDSLGDIVFVELPEVGTEINANDVLGVVESVKAASDVFSPISGVVININEMLEDNPELVNEKPYESWIVKLQITDNGELDDLLSPEEYKQWCLEEE